MDPTTQLDVVARYYHTNYTSGPTNMMLLGLAAIVDFCIVKSKVTINLNQAYCSH